MVEFEITVLDYIYGLHNPILDKIMVFITHLGDMGILWIAIGVVMCFIPKYRRAGVVVLLALLIDLIVANITLKPLIARKRPYDYVDGISMLIERPHDFSFPSGHSFSSFAASFSIFLYHKKEGTVALILASFIAFSRLYIYVHFPSDVICGSLFGIAAAYIARIIVNKSPVSKRLF